MAQSIYEASATRVVVIVPDDDEDLADVPRALWIGGSGDLEVIAEGDTAPAVLIEGLTAGTLLPLRVKRVLEGTTASPVLGMF